MKLYLVHCGFYDQQLAHGLYESHVNYFVAAENFEDARKKARQFEEFKVKKMHVDGIQEIHAVDGFTVVLEENPVLKGASQLINLKHRELAPSTNAPPSPTV